METQTITQTKQATISDKDISVVVKVKPGSSSEKGVLFLLPKDMNSASLKEIIEYSLGQDNSRKYERVIDRLKTEMKKNYGVTLNGEKTDLSQSISTYVSGAKPSQLDDGTQYKELEIIVASAQEGGVYIR